MQENKDYIPGLISIIVPVYNVNEYLDRCIESIVSQTYHKIEILLVDDGSSDGSSDKCDLWKKKDDRIKVYHKKNGGLSSARNLGIEKSAGEWIGFVDSDDYIENDMYESMIKIVGENTDIVCCGTVNIYPRKLKREIDVYGKSPKLVHFNNQEALKELLLIRYLSFSACDKLFRKHLFSNIKFPKGKECEDIPTIYKIVKKSREIINIGKIKYFYCYREGSISRKPFVISRLDYVLAARDIVKDIKKNKPELNKMAEAMYIRNIFVVICEIMDSQTSDKYFELKKRLIKVLERMQFSIWFNKYIERDLKENITELILKKKRDRVKII